jgi:hypothetical protein
MIGWGQFHVGSPFSRKTPSTPQSAVQAGAADAREDARQSLLRQFIINSTENENEDKQSEVEIKWAKPVSKSKRALAKFGPVRRIGKGRLGRSRFNNKISPNLTVSYLSIKFALGARVPGTSPSRRWRAIPRGSLCRILASRSPCRSSGYPVQLIHCRAQSGNR